MLRSVAVLVLDELAVFEFGVLCEVFGMDRTDDGVPLLDFRVCGVEAGRPVSTTGGVQVVPEHGLDGLRGADLVAVPATSLREFPPAVLQALRDTAAAGATLLTVCSGVFVLGAAGLLDGRRCTAHWRSVDELRARHPEAIIDPDVLFVDDGNLVTSAGTAAGIDAALQRVLLAQRLLEDTDLAVDDVAERCGFGTGALLRHHFRKVVGVAPADYRRTFRATPCPEPAAASA